MIYCKYRIIFSTIFASNAGFLRLTAQNPVFDPEGTLMDYSSSTISRSPYAHTDNRCGVDMHFLAYMLSGWARLVSVHEDITVQTGEMLYIPLHCRYQSYWYGHPTVSWISLAFRDFPDPAGRAFPLQRIVPTDSDRDRMLAIPRDRPVDCTAAGQLLTLLGQLLPRMVTADPDPRAAQIRQSVQYMEAHPRAPIPELAKQCGMSESAYYALFRTVTGRTPGAMKQKLLAERAAALLTSTDLPVETISDRLGFSSAAYFRKVLHAQLGRAPRDIRRSRKNI